MIAQAIALILNAFFDLFILAALVRFWMQALRAPTRNPIAQFTMALTDWAVKPLRRVIPGVFNLDWASLVLAWAFEFLLQFGIGLRPLDEPAPDHLFSSGAGLMIRLIARTTWSQRDFCAANCFRPAGVSR